MTKQMPDLAEFLECTDKKTHRQKRDMGRMLAKLTVSLDNQRSTFEGNWKPDKKLFEKADYLAALSKAARLERMVVILHVHDWCRRSGFKEVVERSSPEHPLPDIAYAESLSMWTRTVVTGQ